MSRSKSAVAKSVFTAEHLDPFGGVTRADTVAGNSTTTASVTVGGSVQGTIDSTADVDWYSVALVAGTTYTFSLTGTAGSGGALGDPILTGLYNAIGQFIPGTYNDDFGGSLNSQVTFTASSTGTYFVGVDGYGSATGDFQLAVVGTGGPLPPINGDTVGDSVGTATRITLGTATAGTIDAAGDQDWYSVTLRGRQSYVIDLTSPNGSVDPTILGVYGPNGQFIPGTVVTDTNGDNARLVITAPAAGTYTIAVGGENGDTGDFSLSVTQTARVTEFLDNGTTSGLMRMGRSITSTIETGSDVDWMGVTLQAGSTYRFDVGSTLTSGGPDMRIVGVVDASGNVLPGTSVLDTGANGAASLTFTAATSGNFFLAVASEDGTTGAYRAGVVLVPDTTAPTLVSSSPSDNGAAVPVGQSITLTFSEAVRAGTGNFTITGGGQTITLAANSPQVTITGNTVTLNPAANLAGETAYVVNWTQGAVTDAAGNRTAAVTGDAGVNFTTAVAPPPSAGDNWTVLVYIAGDNDLEGFGVSDINEMESVDLPDSVNVVSLFDRASGYSSASGNWTDTRMAEIVYDGGNQTMSTFTNAGTSIGERNTGQAATLTQFLDWAAANYQAENYMLVIWNHGAGLDGVAWDDASNGDFLSASEVVAGISNSVIGHIDIVGYDACLMGMTEMAFDLEGLADVMIASQELEPGDGWAYDNFLSELAADPTLSAEELAAAVVTTYAAEYAGQSDITLSSVDINALGTLETALDGFVFRALQLGNSNADWNVMRTAAAQTTDFPSDGSADFGDLGQFMSIIAQTASDAQLRTAASAVASAVDTVVLAEAGTVNAATGLAIYLPYGSESVASNYTASNYSFLSSVDWDDFLRIL